MFAYIGGEKIVELTKKTGMAEAEVIEHPLISKSILNDREKMASKVNLEQSAGSQQAWIEKNLK